MRDRRRFDWATTLVVVGVAAIVIELIGAAPWSAGGSTHQRVAQDVATIAPGNHGTQYQELAALNSDHQVSASPGGRPFEQIGASRPITGERTVLPVLRTAVHERSEWLEVRLPGRPNGLTGWIQQAGTKLEFTPWRIVVNTARRRVLVFSA